VTRTTYDCEGCRERIECKDDLRKAEGTVRTRWRCALCGTTVPGVVAEKIKHQD
jgi:hypothetical protein